MKKTAGFTLVELIVVIAILAILAGIAIPVYSGYIAKAQEASDMQILDSLKTACAFAVVDKNHDASLSKIEVKVTSQKLETVTITYTYKDADGTDKTATLDKNAIIEYVGDPVFKYVGEATWENAAWTTTKAA